MTPNLPEATCLIADLFEIPSSRVLKRIGSSPPSPVLDLPPSSFIAMARASWDSVDIDPRLIAPVANLLTIFDSDSTLFISMGLFFEENFRRPLNALSLVVCSLACFAKSQ